MSKTITVERLFLTKKKLFTNHCFRKEQSMLNPSPYHNKNQFRKIKWMLFPSNQSHMLSLSHSKQNLLLNLLSKKSKKEKKD